MPTFVVCTVFDQPFGFPIEVVEEIVRMPWLTAVSEAPADIRGVVDFRGVVVAVLDPAPRLVDESCRIGLESYLVLLSADTERVALVIDGVRGLIEGAPTAPPATAEVPPFVVGHLRGDGDLVTILDVDALIRPDVRDFLRRAHLGEREAATTS